MIDKSKVDLITLREREFFRLAWVYRWIGWICGWGTTVLASTATLWVKEYPEQHSVAFWCGLLAAMLAAINSTVKPEVWADAYYKGHIILDQATGNAILDDNLTPDYLQRALEAAESGLPGATVLVKKI